jgi:hypothetical protein
MVCCSELPVTFLGAMVEGQAADREEWPWEHLNNEVQFLIQVANMLSHISFTGVAHLPLLIA